MYRVEDKYAKNLSRVVKHYFLANYNRLSDYDIFYSYKNYTDIPFDSFPFVVLIGGVGGSGKSSFISFCKKNNDRVYEESTIDCCRQVVNFMDELETKVCGSLPSEYRITQEIKNKSDKYRTLLHKIKEAWVEFDDGPNNIVLDLVEYRLMEEDPLVIFINVREPDQIDHLKSRLYEEYKCIPITMKLHRDNAESWSNNADLTTDDYNYDIVIDNSGSMMQLEDKANKFCVAVAETCIEMSRLLKPFLSLDEDDDIDVDN